jgi:hypothetical protein
MELRIFACRVPGKDVLSLEAVAVSGNGYDPYERNTSGVDTCTTTKDEAAVFENIPVETNPRGNVRKIPGHIGGRVACEGVASLAKLKEFLVGISGDVRIDRKLETDTGGKLEVIAESNLVLSIPGCLHVFESRINLCEIVTVGVGDSKCYRLATSLEILPAVIYIVTRATLHITVLGLVVLELETESEVMDAVVYVNLIGSDISLNLAKVAIGERIKTKGSEKCVYLFVVGGIYIRLQDINCREYAALERTRLVLAGPGKTEHVGNLVADTAVELGCKGGEVLLLIVTAALEILCILRKTSVIVSVIRIRVNRVDRRRRSGRIVVMSMAEPYVKLVVLVDNPVETGHKLVVRGLERVSLITPGAVVVFILKEGENLFKECCGRTEDGTLRIEVGAGTAASFAYLEA